MGEADHICGQAPHELHGLCGCVGHTSVGGVRKRDAACGTTAAIALLFKQSTTHALFGVWLCTCARVHTHTCLYTDRHNNSEGLVSLAPFIVRYQREGQCRVGIQNIAIGCDASSTLRCGSRFGSSRAHAPSITRWLRCYSLGLTDLLGRGSAEDETSTKKEEQVNNNIVASNGN